MFNTKSFSFKVFFVFVCLFGLLQSTNVNSAASKASIVCGKEKNGKYLCYTNEKSKNGKKGKKYTGNSLKEIVQKHGFYGRPILYRDLESKKTEIIVWESKTSNDFSHYNVDTSKANWQSSFESYSWWDSSLDSSSSSAFYEDALEEYSEEYSSESNDDTADYDDSDGDNDSSDGDDGSDDDNDSSDGDDDSDDDNDSSDGDDDSDDDNDSSDGDDD